MAGKADIRAGGAFVELFVKGAKLEAGLNQFAAKINQFGETCQSIGTKIAAVGASAMAGFGAAVKQFADSGDELAKMAQRTGMTVEALSQLRYAAGQSGASIDDVEKAAKKMAAVLHDAAGGSEAATKTLTDLGLSIADLDGKSPDEQFHRIAMALSAVSDASTRAALAQDIFGRSGTQLLPLFAEGEKGLEALRLEAERLGVTMSAETADSATRLGDAMDRVKSSIGGVANAVGSALAPHIEALANKIAFTIGKVAEWVRNNERLVVIAGAASVVITAVGTALIGLGTAATLAGAAIAGLSTIIGTAITVVSAIGAPIALLIAPVVLLAAEVTALGAAFVYASGLVPQLVATLGPLLGAIKAIGAEMLAGNFSKAWDIAAASIRYVGSLAMDVFDQLPEFAGYAAGRLTKAFIDGFKATWNWILSQQERVLTGMLEGASQFAPQLLAAMFSGNWTSAAANIAMSMRNVLKDVTDSAAGFGAGLAGGEAPKLDMSERSKALKAALAELTKPAAPGMPPPAAMLGLFGMNMNATGGGALSSGSGSALPDIQGILNAMSAVGFAAGTNPSAGNLRPGASLTRLGTGFEQEPKDTSRVSVTFSAAAAIAQGMGGQSGRDPVTNAVKEQVSESKKANELLKRIDEQLAKGHLVFT